MLTEMAQVCLWHSDGQTAVEGQPFQESLKGSVVGNRAIVLKHISV